MEEIKTEASKVNVPDPEDIIMGKILSSKEINIETISDKDLKSFIGERVAEANYLKEDWQARAAVERIFEVIKKERRKGREPKKGLAIASLIFGIIGGYPAFSTVSIVAIICGHIALNKIKKDHILYEGKGFAIAGLILGYLGLAIGLFVVIMRGIISSRLDNLPF
jgi:hypothetical protein